MTPIATPAPPAVAVRHRERRYFSWLNPSPDSTALFIARLGLGIVMLMHGLQKVGAFGGGGWSATIQTFATRMDIPPPMGALVILTELVGGAALLLGFLSRFAALAVGIEMVVAASLVHVKNGFFINWYLEPGKGHGFEMNLVLVALALAVLVEGGGRFAVENALARRAARGAE